jgi:hypothetical protein
LRARWRKGELDIEYVSIVHVVSQRQRMNVGVQEYQVLPHRFDLLMGCTDYQGCLSAATYERQNAGVSGITTYVELDLPMGCADYQRYISPVS